MTELLILVGAGNPQIGQYNDAYHLLERMALRNGYTAVDWSIRWPGQIGVDQVSSTFRFDASVAVALEKIAAFERRNVPFHILGRSIGALVAAFCVAQRQPSQMTRLVLWGPPVYWLMWEKYVQDFDASRLYNLTKGVNVAEDYFASLVPFESLISKIECECIVACGTKDEYCSAGFLSYLSTIVAVRSNYSFRKVEDAPHAVTDTLLPAIIIEYEKALFS